MSLSSIEFHLLDAFFSSNPEKFIDESLRLSHVEFNLLDKIFDRAATLARKRFYGIQITNSQIEYLAACVDVFHNRGLHEMAHCIDEIMCEWCELLIDAHA
tara:strand:- start:6047 stop:6349 length:303 start_codon:yes stop_codon:yes gene_type:complete